MNTEKIITDMQMNAREELDMRARLEHFFRQWAPDHPALRDQFYTEFHMLTSRIYMEAQKPFLKTLCDAMALQPRAPIIMKETETMISKFSFEEWRDHFLPAYYPKRTEGLPDELRQRQGVEGLTGTLRPAIEAGLAAVATHRAAAAKQEPGK